MPRIVRRCHSRLLVAAAALVLAALAIAPPALADPFDVQSEAEYQRLLQAGVAAQIVQQRQSMTPQPRVAAGIAALSVCGARNPLAAQSQLEAFAAAYDTLLGAAIAQDAQLTRSSHLVAAVRFRARVTGDAALAGLDTDVGEAVLSRLGMAIDASSRQQRSEQLERSDHPDLANSAALGRLLVETLMGVDASGQARPGLSEAAAAFLRSKGIEPFPTPAALQAEYPEIAAARAAVPADFASFEAQRAAGLAGIRDAIRTEVDQVLQHIDGAVTQIGAALEANQDLYAAAANASDPALLAVLAAQREADLRQRAGARAAIGLNALLLAQSNSPEDRVQVEIMRDFSGITLQADSTCGDWQVGIQIGGSALAFLASAYTGDAGGAIGSLTSVVSGIVGVAAPQGPAPEEQIFSQIIELRQQVEGLRVEMNRQFDRVFGRFDSIDQQLNIIYTELGASLNQLNETTRQIDGNVQQIQSALVDVRIALNRIEQNLYGAIFAGFLQDYVAGADFALGYRERFNLDLPFVGAAGFGTYESLFYSWATSFASDNTYAGPTSLSLANNATASDVLGAVPLGVNINNLRQFPAALGLPVLSSSRLVNPTIWADCAWSYAQLARENPWYFAKLIQNSPSRIADVVLAGDRAAAAMRNARSQAIMTRLVADARARATALASAVAAEQQVYVSATFPNLSGIDLWADASQSIDGLGVGPALPDSVEALYRGSFAFSRLPGEETGRLWQLFPSEIGIALHLQVPGIALAQFSFTVDAEYIPFDADEYTIVVLLSIHRNGQLLATRRQAMNVLATSADEAELVLLELFGDQDDDMRRPFFDPVGTTYVPRFPDYGVTSAGPRALIVVPANLVSIAAGANAALDARRPLLSAHMRQRLTQATPMRDAALLLAASRDLLDAYTSMAIPETLNRSDVIRAVLRGKDGVGLDALDAIFQGQYFGTIRPPAALTALLHTRLDAFAAEIAPSLAPGAAAQSHTSLEWTLANLRDAQTNARRLCADDAYFTPAGAALMVDAGTGVLSNDARQPGAAIAAQLALPPSSGNVTLFADGSFTFTSAPGFTGTDSFTYIATANLAPAGEPPNLISALPATVTVFVCAAGDCPGASPCPADFNSDDFVNPDDLSDFITCFFLDVQFPGVCPEADFNADGFRDPDDLSDFITVFFLGC